MAQAVADATGATKRQVQIWTDAGAILCIPETDRQGRGRQRLYDRSELPFVALVNALSIYKVPIGYLVKWTSLARIYLGDQAHKLGKHSKAWCKSAMAGERESFLVFYWSHEGRVHTAAWTDSEGLGAALRQAPMAIVVNVQETLSPYAV